MQRLLKQGSILAAFVAAALAASAPSSARAATAGEQECTNALATAKVAESGGQLRDARIAAQTCAVDPCSDDVQASCAEILDRIDRTIASVTVAVVDAHGQPVRGAQVTIGEHTFAPGETVVLEPGDYSILIEAPDGTQVTRLIRLSHGEAKEESVILTNGREQGPTATPSSEPALETIGTTTSSLPDGRRGPVINGAELQHFRRLGVTAAAIGFVSLGIGVYYALLAHENAVEDGCTNGQCASQANLSIHETATHDRNTAIGFLVAGAVIGGGGALLWYSARDLATEQPPDIGLRPRSIRVAPSVGLSGGGLTVLGTF